MFFWGVGGVTYSKLALPIDPYPLCTTMPVIRPHSKYAQSLLPHINATIYLAIYPTGKPISNPQTPSQIQSQGKRAIITSISHTIDIITQADTSSYHITQATISKAQSQDARPRIRYNKSVMKSYASHATSYHAIATRQADTSKPSSPGRQKSQADTIIYHAIARLALNPYQRIKHTRAKPRLLTSQLKTRQDLTKALQKAVAFPSLFQALNLPQSCL